MERDEHRRDGNAGRGGGGYHGGYYHRRDRGAGGGRGGRGGRDGRGGSGGRDGRGGSGGRDGRGGYGGGNSIGGGGRNGDRGFTSQSQWQPRSTPSNTESPKPDHSHFQIQTETQTHPDIGSLKISEQKTDTIAPVRRPDNGGTVTEKTCNLLVNHFRVSFKAGNTIMHYNVDVKLKEPPEKDRPQKKISKYELSLIRKKLFSENNLPVAAYDGEKNIFSTAVFPKETFSVDVSKGVDETHERTVSYLVTLTLVNKLKLGKLKDYLSGSVLSIPRDILHGLDLVVKENPAKQCVSLGRCFFPMEPPLKEEALDYGIVAIGGFQHSLKSTKQGLALCLDYSVFSFCKETPVLDFIEKHIMGFNMRKFGSFKEHVKDALVGLKVNVTHRKTKQKYTIVGLTEHVTRDIKFSIFDPQNDKSERETSLLVYFKEKYDQDIQHKDIPALVFRGNKTNYVPMEFCVLVKDQRYPKEKLNTGAARVLKDLSVVHPRERKKSIQNMVDSEQGPCSGGVLGSFQMSVNKSMTKVTGRVIKPPQLKLREPDGKTLMSMTLEAENFQWNLVKKSMVEGKSVECWGVLDFTGGYKSQSNQIIRGLIDKYKELGISMNEPAHYEKSLTKNLGYSNLLCKLLEKIDNVVQNEGRKLQFLLCVMSYKHQGYKCLKWIAETKVGMVTQCCLSGNAANKRFDQYLTNLTLKINAKIGGSTVELMNKLPHFEGEGHVMFIGADVNHPASRDTNSPSIAAVVATVNWPAANRYTARVCAQGHRVEKIVNFGKICYELVSYYARLNQAWPEKIVIFRDGVSESQFNMVLTEELEDLKSVFKNANYFPTITLIVAQKRHQTRFFPEATKDGTKSGNVFPGTVVDTKVVHPFEFDFYLCSHYGSLGTSKPTHYHVLWDENKFTSDNLQKLIYEMCYTFARCTKPVSLVPPVYYADLTAYRGRLYYDAMNMHPSAAADRRSFCRLHPEVENIMFFV